MGITQGLGLLRGEVQKFAGRLPVPQIGWNRVSARGALFEGIENPVFYFVNSYAASNAPDEIARADYGGPFTAAVQHGRVFGVQFHPEKSSAAGLQVLRNYIAWT
jgi:glutamine amidotransferase